MHVTVGSITSRCSGNEPTLTPEGGKPDPSWGAAEIEPHVTGAKRGKTHAIEARLVLVLLLIG